MSTPRQTLASRVGQRPRGRSSRHAATAVECAIVLPVALLVLLSLMDLGLAVARYNSLADASRSIARQAIMHGSLSPDIDNNHRWGSNKYIGSAAKNEDPIRAVHDLLPTMTNNKVEIEVTWLDGDHRPGDRVHVLVRYQHKPIVPLFLPWGPLELKSETTMRIVN